MNRLEKIIITTVTVGVWAALVWNSCRGNQPAYETCKETHRYYDEQVFEGKGRAYLLRIFDANGDKKPDCGETYPIIAINPKMKKIFLPRNPESYWYDSNHDNKMQRGEIKPYSQRIIIAPEDLKDRGPMI